MKLAVLVALVVTTSGAAARLQRTAGYNYLALEDDPEIIRLKTAAAVAGGVDSALALARRFPHGHQFWNDQEVAMISAIARLSPRRTGRVWGLDQAWGALHILERLAAIAPNEATRRATLDLAAKVKPLESTRPTTPGGSITRFINTEDSTAFDANGGPRGRARLRAWGG